MLHKLKIHPTHLENKKQGLMPFDIRDNTDRGFQKGDYVQYRPFKDGVYLDNLGDEVLTTKILYVSNFMQKDGYVVYGEVKCPEINIS